MLNRLGRLLWLCIHQTDVVFGMKKRQTGHVQRNVWVLESRIRQGEYLHCVLLSPGRGGGGGGCALGSSSLPGRSPAVHTEGRTVYLSGSAWQPLTIGSCESLHWLSKEMGVVGGGDIHRRINTSWRSHLLPYLPLKVPLLTLSFLHWCMLMQLQVLLLCLKN